MTKDEYMERIKKMGFSTHQYAGIFDWERSRLTQFDRLKVQERHIRLLELCEKLCSKKNGFTILKSISDGSHDRSEGNIQERLRRIGLTKKDFLELTGFSYCKECKRFHNVVSIIEALTYLDQMEKMEVM